MSLKNLGLRRQGAALLLLSSFTAACNRPVSVQAQAQLQAPNTNISLPGPDAIEPASFHCAADDELVYTCTLTEEAKQAYLQAHPKPVSLPPRKGSKRPSTLPAMLPTLMPLTVILPGFKAPASFSCTRRAFEAPLETAYACASPTESAALKRARAAEAVSSPPNEASYQPSH